MHTVFTRGTAVSARSLTEPQLEKRSNGEEERYLRGAKKQLLKRHFIHGALVRETPTATWRLHSKQHFYSGSNSLTSWRLYGCLRPSAVATCIAAVCFAAGPLATSSRAARSPLLIVLIIVLNDLPLCRIRHRCTQP